MDKRRIKNLQAKLQRPILIKKKENLLYLTGHAFDYRSQEYLLIKKNQVVGFGSGLEKMDWAKKVERFKQIGGYLKPKSRLDIEYGFTYAEGKYLEFKMPKVKIAPAQSLVDIARQIKDADESAKVKKSMQIVAKVFAQVKQQLKKKTWTEEKLAVFITQAGLRLGADDIAFPAIVASGANAAIPHHSPSSKKLMAGESIIIDFGFKYKHYCSDFTRTVFLKSVPKKLEVAYNQVEEAYNRAFQMAKSGIKAEALYGLTVKTLEEKKLSKYFIHSLGHGTGLEIHELPNLSPKSKDILKNNMVFSIEPGVYFPKLGGIRIEDLVYLEKGKCKKFINVSTKLPDNII